MILLRKISLVAVSGFLTVLYSGVAGAQAGTQPGKGGPERIPDVSPTNPAMLPTEDTHLFLRQMHAVNQAEIKAGEMAISKSSNADIRSYATMLVNSHQALDRELTEIAAFQKLELTPDEGAQQFVDLQKSLKADMDSLATAEANSFDETFLDVMIKTHDAAIPLAKDAIPRLRVVSARQLADKALATFTDHKARAEQLKSKLMSH